MKLIVRKEIFNEVYLPYVEDWSHRYEVFYGGAGSGKSFFVG
jgi:phage terminase large subunit